MKNTRSILKKSSFILLILTALFSNLKAQEVRFNDVQNMNVWYNQSLKVNQSREFRSAFRKVEYEGILAFNTNAVLLNIPLLNKEERENSEKDNYFNVSAGAAFESNGDLFKQSLGLLGISYAVRLTENKVYASIGFQTVLTQTKISPIGTGFPDQYNEFGPIPYKASMDPLQTGKRFQMISLNVGASIFKKSTEKEWYVGVSLRNANKPFAEDTKKVDYQLSPAFGSQVGLKLIHDKYEVDYYGLVNLNNFENEILLGGRSSFYIGKSKKVAEKNAIGFGCAYRLNDALIPSVNLSYEGTRISFQYDINASGMNKSIISRSGYEVTIMKNF